jgi:hypothetical protein
MRKLWPLVAALVLGVAGPVPAQFSVTGAQVKNAPNTNAATSLVPSAGLPQMLPKTNMSSAVSNPFGGTKTLNFTRMLPTFSNLRTGLWPVRSPTLQSPTTAGNTTGKKK